MRGLLRGAGSSKSIRRVSPPSSVMTHLLISGSEGNDGSLLEGSKLLVGCDTKGAIVFELGIFNGVRESASIGLRLCLVLISVEAFLKVYYGLSPQR